MLVTVRLPGSESAVLLRLQCYWAVGLLVGAAGINGVGVGGSADSSLVRKRKCCLAAFAVLLVRETGNNNSIYNS